MGLETLARCHRFRHREVQLVKRPESRGPRLGVRSRCPLAWQGGPASDYQAGCGKVRNGVHPAPEDPKKLKVVLNDYSDPYLWSEGEGQLTFERASELLLKPILFS